VGAGGNDETNRNGDDNHLSSLNGVAMLHDGLADTTFTSTSKSRQHPQQLLNAFIHQEGQGIYGKRSDDKRAKP